MVPAGKFDIHADGGAWCYVGLRHSFCHGWASGPTAWLSEHVLGVQPVGEGFRQVRIQPHLGRLEWAEGTFPTPYGLIEVRHERQPDGSVQSTVKLPRGVRLDDRGDKRLNGNSLTIVPLSQTGGDNCLIYRL